MANDTVLSKAQAIALLQKLSSDDAFRSSYQANPLAALIGMGVPANQLPANMAPIAALADKSVFANALAHVQADLANVCACQQPPKIQINFGR